MRGGGGETGRRAQLISRVIEVPYSWGCSQWGPNVECVGCAWIVPQGARKLRHLCPNSCAPLVEGLVGGSGSSALWPLIWAKRALIASEDPQAEAGRCWSMWEYRPVTSRSWAGTGAAPVLPTSPGPFLSRPLPPWAPAFLH